MKRAFIFITFLFILWIANASASPFPCDCIGGYNPYITPTFWYLLDYYGNVLEDGDCVCAYWVGPNGAVEGPDPALAPLPLGDDVMLEPCGYIEYGGFYFSVTTWGTGEGHPERGEFIYCIIYDGPCDVLGVGNYYGISDLHEVENYLGEMAYFLFPGDPGYGHTDTRISVELIIFEALAGDREVLLRWKTVSETNVLGFYVERGDVRSDIIPAAGNSEVENVYTYLDRNLTNGVTYSYNLIAIDMDGIECVLNSEPVSATPLAKPMPIELLFFTAIGGDNEVVLQWRTATEMGAQGFYIERDGHLVTDELIPAFGNSSIEINYSYIDSDVENGVTYSYNLIVLDEDGWEFLANEQPVSATPNPAINVSLGPVQPNPFSRNTSIFYTTPGAIHVLMEVYDITGLKLSTLVDEKKEAGQYSVNWDASKLTSGVYFCRMKAGAFDETIELWLVKESEGAQVANNHPTSFHLTQNYPNPFNAIAEIKYEIPKDIHVILKIFNVRGQETITLVDTDLSTGTYTATWDGRDANGREMSAGIYFCTMRAGKAGEFTQTRKMVLLR
jgi:hypothetical protein